MATQGVLVYPNPQREKQKARRSRRHIDFCSCDSRSPFACLGIKVHGAQLVFLHGALGALVLGWSTRPGAGADSSSHWLMCRLNKLFGRWSVFDRV